MLLAKSEVDRVMGELTEARQTVQSLQSQLDTALVYTVLSQSAVLCSVLHHRKRKRLIPGSW